MNALIPEDSGINAIVAISTMSSSVFKPSKTTPAKVKGMQPGVMILAIIFIEIANPDNSFLGTQFQGICHLSGCEGGSGFPKS